jgi:hypothetical protein
MKDNNNEKTVNENSVLKKKTQIYCLANKI